ncbi:MAG TPA: AbrB/MazE/SpoVT family DNA-binding domain-containing protein [Dehalococcoidia bacterium]|jgi:AbrB family looped-hinge helix DNA binding protein|nr:AbrB/MazE/SpoVT family DNA-binding domain-containing protein [Dehalococcoidia bacterium]
MATKRAAPRRASKPSATPAKPPAQRRSAAEIKTRALPDPEPGRFVGKYLQGRAKVSSKGWVVIPKEIREEMGLRPGDEVAMYLWPPAFNMKQDRGLYTLYVTRVPENPIELVSGMFKRLPGERPMTEVLLEERRRELVEEERDLPPPRKRQPA